MKYSEIRSYVIEIIQDIAPDSDTSTLNDQDSLSNQLNLDSMDFLDLVMELRKRHKVEIPKEDFNQIKTMECLVYYLGPQFTKLAA
jgi:acyl carrier protein